MNMQTYEFTLENRVRFHEFLVKEDLTDVTLVCEKRIIRCHKLLLAASSQYFHELFSMLGEANPTIVLKDITLVQLTKILEYIYCGKASVPANELNDFKNAAEYFQMSVCLNTEAPVNLLNQSIAEFMSQETTVGNLTLDSFRLQDSDSDCTFTEGESPKEPESKKLKLTDTFGIFQEMRGRESTRVDIKKRNYFEFSDQQMKKVAFEAQSFMNSRDKLKPKRTCFN
ncbi:hypothetical protein ACKWTF_003551 [Chironomus riparius]